MQTGARSARPSPPRTALRLRDVMYAGAALSIVALLLVVGVGLVTLDAGEIAEATAVPGAPEAALAGVIIAFAVLLAVLEAALWVVFGRLFARGYAWARWTGTAMAAANLVVEVPRLVDPPNALAASLTGVEVLVVVVALVLLWSPPMSRYVREVSRWRSVAAV
jgi:hypothetical protein